MTENEQKTGQYSLQSSFNEFVMARPSTSPDVLIEHE